MPIKKLFSRRKYLQFLSTGLLSAFLTCGIGGSPAYAAPKGEQLTPIQWVDPYEKLGILQDDPTPEEEEGILLRNYPPQSGEERWRREVYTFSLVQNGQGIYSFATNDQIITYQLAAQPGTFIKTTKDIYGSAGQSVEVIEQSELGEVLRLLDAYMNINGIQSRITDYYRTSFFPESPAKIGDMWEYEGQFQMHVPPPGKKYKVQSGPVKFKVTSMLVGFADVNGIRTAVIQSERSQWQREIHIKGDEQRIFDNESFVTEWEFWDYSTGTMVAAYNFGDYITRTPDDGREAVNQGQQFLYRI